jgi:hypothetical protein
MLRAIDSHLLQVEGLTLCLIFCPFSLLRPALLPYYLMVVIATNAGHLALGYPGLGYPGNLSQLL